jgi:hypothetical protein
MIIRLLPSEGRQEEDEAGRPGGHPAGGVFGGVAGGLRAYRVGSTGSVRALRRNAPALHNGMAGDRLPGGETSAKFVDIVVRLCKKRLSSLPHFGHNWILPYFYGRVFVMHFSYPLYELL